MPDYKAMYYHLAGRMATAIDALEATTNALVDITEKLKLEPIAAPYQYVKELQAQFDDSKIKFTDEYYDVLGLELPKGRKRKPPEYQYEQVVEITVIRTTED